MATEKPRDTSRPRNASRFRLEVMSVLRAAETGVNGAVIWVAAGEFDGADRHLGPRLLVVLGDDIRADRLTYAVTAPLTSAADALGELPTEIARPVESFVVRNRGTLVRHWRGEIDTRDMLDLLKRVRQ